jgi:formate dehydrogenase alpha subunit
MTRKVCALNERHSEDKLEINPEDAARLAIATDDRVKITSRRGVITARADVTDRNPPGIVYMNFHFAETPTNALTGADYDKQTRTPAYKVTAVKVEKVVSAP